MPCGVFYNTQTQPEACKVEAPQRVMAGVRVRQSALPLHTSACCATLSCPAATARRCFVASLPLLLLLAAVPRCAAAAAAVVTGLSRCCFLHRRVLRRHAAACGPAVLHASASKRWGSLICNGTAAHSLHPMRYCFVVPVHVASVSGTCPLVACSPGQPGKRHTVRDSNALLQSWCASARQACS